MPTVEGLWPTPKQAQSPPGSFTIPARMFMTPPPSEALRVGVDKLCRIWESACKGSLEVSAETLPPDSPHISLNLEADQLTPRESFKLCLNHDHISLSGSCDAGLFYGLMTLCQWLRFHFLKASQPLAQLPLLRVEDHPDFRYRGWMVDISRSKVPTMPTLFALIDAAAEFKINQIQLYTEHTFAYEGHQTVWAEASPLTADEVLALDIYCRDRCIDLVPNQNSFGHFHQWLKHESYRHLAECPEGIQHPFSLDLEPFSLCPTNPESIALLEDLFGQYLPLFRSDFANVGLDETFDLGQGRSAEACETRGKTEVYLDFLNQVHQRLSNHGKRMQFWGDIIIEQPDFLHRLPKDGIALEWGYEADHPFEKHAAKYAQSGCEYFVCPGTSSWSSVLGRIDNALANLASAAKAGWKHGASGYLITDWGDYGHFQPPAISWPAWIAGAGFAWRASDANASFEVMVQKAIHYHLWHTADDYLVQTLWQVGMAYRDCGMQPTNGSSLFYLLLYADQTMSHERLKDLNEDGLNRSRARLHQARQLMEKAEITCAEDRLVVAELTWACNLIDFACDLGSARLASGGEKPLSCIPTQTKKQLGQRLAELVTQFPPLRDQRFRPGGTKAALRYLTRIQAMLAET